MRLTRRTLLAGIAVALPAGGAAAGRPDGDERERLEAFLRLKADLSGRAVAIYYTADIFLLAPTGTLPLVARAEGLSWNRVVRRGDAFELQQIDTGLYRSPATEEPLSSLAIESGGKALPVKPYRNSSSYTATTRSLTAPSLAARPDARLDLDRHGPIETDDQVWAHEDLQVAFGSTGRRVAQLTTYAGPAAALRDPTVTSVPATSFSAMVTDTRPLVPALEPPRPALWRLVGRKLAGADRAPPRFRAWLAATHPDLLTEPRFG